jgi:hypothetical protein
VQPDKLRPFRLRAVFKPVIDDFNVIFEGLLNGFKHSHDPSRIVWIGRDQSGVDHENKLLDRSQEGVVMCTHIWRI